MKKSLVCFTICLASIVILSFPIVGVFATKPIPVSATSETNMVPIPVKFAGPNTFFEVTGTGKYIDGDFEGTTVGVHRWHINKDGKMNLHAEVIFTGSILGKSGSITMLCNGLAGKRITWTIVSGTGELSDLKGGGTILPNSIQGYVHFDP